jgi:hypothetical protein
VRELAARLEPIARIARVELIQADTGLDAGNVEPGVASPEAHPGLQDEAMKIDRCRRRRIVNRHVEMEFHVPGERSGLRL